MQEVLVLFSGGKDSLLSTIRYLDNGYKTYLVTYDNACGIGTKNALTTAKRLVKKYGKEKVILLGIKDISPIFREMIHPFYNYKLDYINSTFGNISISQFNCLACRASMYAMSIIFCKQLGIKLVIDGARKSQLFAIEQVEMLKEFASLFLKYDLTINYPLKDLENDWDLKNELLMRGIIPKTIEPQCLLGCPLKKDNIDNDLIKAIVKVYHNYLLEKIEKCINDYKDIIFIGDYI